MSSEITIVIPAYNHEKYVEQTLVSCANLLCEDRPHILFIDDGSTDKTFEISKNFLDRSKRRFASIRMETRKNSGLVNSLNFALREVKTKYIMAQASDDIFHERAIQILLPAMKADTETALVVGDNGFIDSSGNAVSRTVNGQSFSSFLKSFTSLKPNFKWEQVGQYKTFLTGNYVPCGWFMDVSKFLSIGGWDSSFLVEDWQILVRLTKKYKIRLLEEVTTSYRIHDKNTSKTQAVLMQFDQARIFLQEIDYAKKSGFIEEWLIGFRYTRDALKTNREFFSFFFQNINKLFSHPNFREYLAALLDLTDESVIPNDPLFFERALQLLKVRLMNEVVYGLLKHNPVLSPPESVDTVLYTINVYTAAYQKEGNLSYNDEWKQGIEQILISMKEKRELFDRFFSENSKQLSEKNYTALLAYLNHIPLRFLPQKVRGKWASLVLLILLKTQINVRKCLKPIKHFLFKAFKKIS
jgi:glycosyltransferase involved in cell wall biosynthesis